MRILFCATLVFSSIIAAIFAQEPKPVNTLLLDAGFTKPVVQASKGKFDSQVFFDENGEIVLVVQAKDILTKNHSATGLPSEQNKVGSWQARFKVVPKLNEPDFAILSQIVESMRADNKSDSSAYQRMLERLPNIQNKSYAFSLEMSYLIPVEKQDRERISEFIEALSHEFRACNGKDTRKLLRFLLLDERG